MPTGYTAPVQSGEVSDLRTFAMQCARAFGALVSMRDDPKNAKIPDRLEICSWHDERLAEALARQSALHAMSETEIAMAADVAYETAVTAHAARTAERALHKQRYEAMLEHIQAWHPPDVCSGLKDFMAEQLATSISHDCDGRYDDAPARLDSVEWLEQELKHCERDIRHHTKERAEEVARTDERNLWLNALRVSLVNAS